jgi:hypothetical protein
MSDDALRAVSVDLVLVIRSLLEPDLHTNRYQP